MKLLIVVPCYNEEAVLPETTQRLLDVLQRLRDAGQISEGQLLFVDDGSRDTTWKIIEEKSALHKEIIGLKLAHNQGHQHALWAGLEYAASHCEAAISIDADLQDDVEAIPQMVELFNKGKDIVYGVRKARKTDTWFKRTTAQAFYRFMQSMGGSVVYNHADFRLMSRRTLQALMEHRERNLFLRGMVSSLGYPSASVYYDRAARFAGESKYPLFKMLAFAIDGITSFSIRPLQYILVLGVFFIFIALCAIVYGLVAWAQGRTILGWTTLFVSLWLIGGAILIACSIIGEYVGKIYIEVKQRPRYLIEKTAGEIREKGIGKRE